MRIVDAIKQLDYRRDALDPSHPRHVTGSPEEQQQARQEWHRHKRIQSIVDAVEREIPRSELVFERHWIEHEPSGEFYDTFDGDPEFATNVTAYFVSANGDPVMLVRKPHPSSRAELERLVAQTGTPTAASPMADGRSPTSMTW